MSKNSKAPGFWTMSVGDREASLKALEDAIREQGGRPRDFLDALRTDKRYAGRIAQAMMRYGLAESIETRLALGRNIFTDADWMSYYEAKFTKKQLRLALKFPWGEDVLSSPCPFNKGKRVKDTHFAFLGLERVNGEPLTVAKWLQLHPKTGQPRFYFAEDPWHAGQPHTDETTLTFKWQLLLQDIVPNSTDKTPQEQVAMLPDEYEVPTTIAEVTKDILVFRKTGPRPNPSRWAACTERTVKTDNLPAEGVGYVSCVGYFDENGLIVSCWDGGRHHGVGVGASRKS